MPPRLSGQNSIFRGVFVVSKSLWGIEEQKELCNFVMKVAQHVRILRYRMWPIRSVIAMFTKNLHAVPVHMRFVFRVIAIINTFLVNEMIIMDVNAVTLLDFLMFFSPRG